MTQSQAGTEEKTITVSRRILNDQPVKYVGNCNPEAIVRWSKTLKIHDRLLHHRVYNSADAEVQLRPCVPTGVYKQMQMPGLGERPEGYRQFLFLTYHSAPKAGHLGRDKTISSLERD